jgi:glycosyltransferase involved in cell wall biosynthesis
MKQLRVGLNLLFMSPGSAGAGRYATELVRALADLPEAPALTVFVSRDVPETLAGPWAKDVDVVRLPVASVGKQHLLAQMAALPALAARRRLDVIHSPANVGPLVTPGTARVVTLLDVIWLRQGDAWEQGRTARMFGGVSRLCARNAHRILAISESARADIAAGLELLPDRIDVAPLGVRPPTVSATRSPEATRAWLRAGERPIVLCVAQKRPYKNLAVLLRALTDLPEPILVLPGAPTDHEQELRVLADSLGVGDRVRFLSYISEQELEELYGAATCFVLPSLIEGFGLPVLEAMARDLPVACSNRPALPEVVGNAAILFDPKDQQAVTRAIRELLEDADLRRKLIERGRERVRLFSWSRTAEATVASYERAVAARRGQPPPV